MSKKSSSSGRSRNGEGRDYLNKSLDKALSILEYFDTENSGLSITEIARQCGSNPSSLYPIIHTLEKYGYLKRDDNKRYRLGLNLAKKGRIVLNSMELSEEARPELKKLRDNTGKTVHLGYLNEGSIVYIDKVESMSGLRMYSSPGKTAPLHATALGKVIMAHIPEGELEHLLGELEFTQQTPNTITTVNEMKEEIHQIKNTGYAVDDEEFERGIRCIAAPIHGHDGNVKAAVSVTSLKAQMEDDAIGATASTVKNAADRISKKLGYDNCI